MEQNLATYLIVVVAISAGLIAWVLNTWIRARHGIPTDEQMAFQAMRESREADRNMPLLIEQNERLTGLVTKLEERIAVLESIVTDPAGRTAREIETLR